MRCTRFANAIMYVCSSRQTKDGKCVIVSRPVPWLFLFASGLALLVTNYCAATMFQL